jgi:H+/gluconate symporter-like permease
MQVISLLGIIVAIIFVNVAMYRGLGLPLACIFSAMIIWITGGVDIATGYSDAIGETASTFARMCSVFGFGAILGMLYAKSGAAASLGLAFFSPFKKVKNQNVKMLGTIFMFFVMRFVLALSGIDNMALIVTTVALVTVLFSDLDMPRKYANAMLMCAGTIPTFMPGAPTMLNVILPTFLPGFTAMSCFVPRMLFLIIFICLASLWLFVMIKKDMDKGEHYVPAKGMDIGDLNDPNVKRPFWVLTLLPLILVYVLCSFASMDAWLALFIGCILAGILFIPYIRVPEGRGKFGYMVEQMNDSYIQIPLYYNLTYLPAYAMMAVPGWTLLTNWMNSLAASSAPLPLTFGLVCTILVPVGSSALVINANIASEIFVPAGLAAGTAGSLLIVANTVLDTLPNSPGMIMQADLTETPLRVCYPSIFKTTVVLTFGIMLLAVLFACIGLM